MPVLELRSRIRPPTGRGRSMMLHARARPHPICGVARTARAQLPATVTVPVLVVAWMTCVEAAARGTDTRTEPSWALAVTRYAVPDGTRMATEPIPELAKICWGGAVNPALIMPVLVVSRTRGPDIPLA